MSALWRSRGGKYPGDRWIFLERGETPAHVRIKLIAETGARADIRLARHGLRRSVIESAPGTASVIGNVVTWEMPNRSETQLLAVADPGLAYLVADVRLAYSEVPTRLYPEASPQITAKTSLKARCSATMRSNAVMSFSNQSSRMVGIA
jgi:hypothetical protein